MSYYDDYDDYYSDDDDEDIYYHNYSVDYAKQILHGHHAISSCPNIRRRRHSPRLLRVATLDHMPINNNRHSFIPQLNSIPKFQQTILPPSRPLPSLEQTSLELERRATGQSQLNHQINNNNNPPPPPPPLPSTADQYQPLTEQQLRQVQQQQQAFQQHLINMQNHLLEQQQEQQQQSIPNRRTPFEKKSKKTYHSFDHDDDQDEIAQLIETDPYFAAAMEDFALTHRLIKHRSPSAYSSNESIDFHHRHSRNSSSSSSSSTISSLTNITSQTKTSKNESMLFRELHELRLLIQDYINNRANFSHYPSGMTMDDQQSQINPKRRIPPPEPNRILYQNVVNVVKEVMERRSPSQQDQPLKPSQIDPTLKHHYTKRPIINNTTLSNNNNNSNRRRSSQLSTPPLTNNIPPPPPPPYENLANFLSSRPRINANDNLSYGTHPRPYFFSRNYF